MPWKLNRNSLRPTISTQVITENAISHQPTSITSNSTSRREGFISVSNFMSSLSPGTLDARRPTRDWRLSIRAGGAVSVDVVAARLADRGVPRLRTLRVDLIAGLLPQRQHHRRDGGLDLLLVGGRQLHQLHVELHAFLAFAADVAIGCIVVDPVGEVPHAVLHFLGLGHQLLLHFGREADRKSTRLNSSHVSESRMPSSA